MLHYNSFETIIVSSEYCIDEESFLIEVMLCPFKSLFFRRVGGNLTQVAFVMFLFKQRRLTFVHFKYTQLLSKH